MVLASISKDTHTTTPFPVPFPVEGQGSKLPFIAHEGLLLFPSPFTGEGCPQGRIGVISFLLTGDGFNIVMPLMVVRKIIFLLDNEEQVLIDRSVGVGQFLNG